MRRYSSYFTIGVIGVLGNGYCTSYTKDDLRNHKKVEDRVWVNYKNKVYDITEFIQIHPGGAEKILLAAGGSVEPYWNLYRQHLTPAVEEILKEYCIGDYIQDEKEKEVVASDPYAHDPVRHP